MRFSSAGERTDQGRGPRALHRASVTRTTVAGSATLLASTRVSPGPADPAAASDAFWYLGPEGAHPAHDPIVAGRKVGGYLLIEPLGAGAQAVVWWARRLEPSGREVALKLLTPDRCREHRRVARLRREAQRGARLNHPAILSTIEFGEADGVVFLAMPLVEGPSLADVIDYRRRRGRRARGGGSRLAHLPEPRYTRTAAGALSRIARALQVAHDAQVVHRDLKPANILLDRGRAGRAFLTDFGLARDLDVATPAQLRDWSGSPLYMAPERLLGRLADEIRCDVYSLGATMFEAVTMARPLRVPPGLRGPILWAQLAEQRPARPRVVRPDLPRELEAIILRAMAPDPSKRFPTAAAMADEIDAFLIGPAGRRRRATGAATTPTPRPEAGGQAATRTQ
jgi:eukaryotic-like serine/threonine-protein kinase